MMPNLSIHVIFSDLVEHLSRFKRLRTTEIMKMEQLKVQTFNEMKNLLEVKSTSRVTLDPRTMTQGRVLQLGTRNSVTVDDDPA